MTMTEEVENTAGHAVHVLDVTDLNKAQARVIRWVVGSGLFVAFACGVWVTKLQAKNDAQDLILTDYQSHAAWSREASRSVDSLRIETRHLAEAVQELNRLIAQRGVR